MLQSVFLALMATLFAVPVAAPLSFLGARNLMRGSRLRVAIYYLVRGFFNIFRSFEVLVVAIIFVAIVGIGPFAGMLGLFIHTVGTVALFTVAIVWAMDYASARIREQLS